MERARGGEDFASLARTHSAAPTASAPMLMGPTRLGRPVAILNLGVTRGDGEADLKLEAPCGETLAALERVDSNWPENDHLNEFYRDWTRVQALTRIGDYEQVLDILEARLGEPGGFTVWQLRLDPRLDPLRDMPRFKALVAD